MQIGDQFSADAIYAQTLHRARVFERASRRKAAAGEALSALIFAWGADISLMQTSLFERVVLGAKALTRQYFAEAQTLLAAFDPTLPDTVGVESVADMQLRVREQLFRALPRDLAMDVTGRLPDITYLAALPAPTADAMRRGVRERLQGLSSTQFCARRRRDADELMLQALAAHARADKRSAADLSYQSVVLCLEAYLVESAEAAGDHGLWTVELRWELGTCAMSELVGLPDDFHSAVITVREALAHGLGEPDGTRFLSMLPDLGS
ncbi:MAG: hypothetical protein Q8L05_00805 [Actinomycetota bacterium]|nr:hypothetical protein [Actinomycetota bacterium]MDP2289389.1 hypothetical protein [Actinomycetota bacterium]